MLSVNRNSNEPIPQDAGAEELPEALKQALREAYPDPKGRIAAKVMEQIHAEREKEGQASRSRQNERRRRNALIMKYGGMAACMVILSGALVIASPLLGRSSDKAAMDIEYRVEAGGAAEETVQETAPAAAVMYTADAAAYADEEEVEEAEEEAEETTRLTASSSVSKEAETEETAPANGMVKMFAAPRPSGDPDDAALADAASEEAAPESDNAVYLQSLLDAGVLTEEEYAAWMKEMGYTDPEDWTIEEFEERFLTE